MKFMSNMLQDPEKKGVFLFVQCLGSKISICRKRGILWVFHMDYNPVCQSSGIPPILYDIIFFLYIMMIHIMMEMKFSGANTTWCCMQYTKGALKLGNPHRARARLTPEVWFIWLVRVRCFSASSTARLLVSGTATKCAHGPFHMYMEVGAFATWRVDVTSPHDNHLTIHVNVIQEVKGSCIWHEKWKIIKCFMLT